MRPVSYRKILLKGGMPGMWLLQRRLCGRVRMRRVVVKSLCLARVFVLVASLGRRAVQIPKHTPPSGQSLVEIDFFSSENSCKNRDMKLSSSDVPWMKKSRRLPDRDRFLPPDFGQKCLRRPFSANMHQILVNVHLFIQLNKKKTLLRAWRIWFWPHCARRCQITIFWKLTDMGLYYLPLIFLWPAHLIWQQVYSSVRWQRETWLPADLDTCSLPSVSNVRPSHKSENKKNW